MATTKKKTSTTAKRTRQPDVTRRNIVDAALYEFAAKGLAGARVDEIAARSGSNKRMIYEYFGNKEGLWLFVLERAYEKMREEEHAIDVARMPPVDGMRYLMEFNFRFCSRNPEFIALLNAENLHKAAFLRKSKKIRQLYSPLLVVISDLLERGQRDGVFRKGIDPVELYITIAALGFSTFPMSIPCRPSLAATCLRRNSRKGAWIIPLRWCWATCALMRFQ